MELRGGTVRAYLQAIGRVATIPGATEHTYRAALGEFRDVSRSSNRDFRLEYVGVQVRYTP